MKRDMDFESMDWDAEAKRVARAFGIKNECYFEECMDDEPSDEAPQIGVDGYRELCFDNGRSSFPLPEGKGMAFWCRYHTRLGASYAVHGLIEQRTSAIIVEWDGSARSYVEILVHAPILAKGLFHLGLLTPNAEAALKVSVSAHEKINWTMEYEARYGL